MFNYHVLSLGAGVQSTAIYLLAMDGEIEVRFTAAIFADTQEEPVSVYRHLEWLKSLGGPPIHVVSVGKLGDDLVNGRNSTSQRFASIPAFVSNGPGKKEGMVRRQCTTEYKIEPIEKWIRYEMLSLKPRQRIPDEVKIHQYMGFSYDEPGRAARAKNRFRQVRWGDVHFPLFDLEMTRADCVAYLKGRVPHQVPRSACVFCPFKKTEEWVDLKLNDPAGWKRAVEVDATLRKAGVVANRNMEKELYIHRSCMPLDQVDFKEKDLGLFELECEGGCGL